MVTYRICMCAFLEMRCCICNQEWGHSPQCILTQLDDPIELWNSTAPMDDTLMPWAMSPPQWLLGETLDPNMILPVPAAVVVPDSLDGVYDILRNMAGDMGGSSGPQGMSPDASLALRSWLDAEQTERTEADVSSGVGNPLPLPNAWAALNTGLEALDAVSGVREEDDELGNEVTWGMLHCDEPGNSLDRPERPDPTAYEMGVPLVGHREGENTRSGEVGPEEMVLPVGVLPQSINMLRFDDAPASPDNTGSSDFGGLDSPEGMFRPIRDVPILIPLEPVAPVSEEGSCQKHRGTGNDENQDEPEVDSREGLAVAPEEGREVLPSPIQSYWTRLQARRDGVVERARGRVAHIRPMPRVGGRRFACYHRPDPRVFRLTTTAPVVRSLDVISRVTSPMGSIAEETLAERVHMARDHSTQVPRIRQRNSGVQVRITAPQRTVSTQTLIEMMGMMSVDPTSVTSDSGDDVTLRASPAVQAVMEIPTYSDVSSDGVVDGGATQGEVSASEGTPLQDEHEC
jgi:hypothetical protein